MNQFEANYTEWQESGPEGRFMRVTSRFCLDFVGGKDINNHIFV